MGLVRNSSVENLRSGYVVIPHEYEFLCIGHVGWGRKMIIEFSSDFFLPAKQFLFAKYTVGNCGELSLCDFQGKYQTS